VQNNRGKTNSVISIGNRIINLWLILSNWPGGAWLFSRIFGLYVPYSSTIGANVKQLRPGYACVELRDRRKVRNHLNSIHAIALMNLGELATGLALLTGLDSNKRGIVINLSMHYVKKARGKLIAIAETETPDFTTELEHQVIAEIKDQNGELVAECTAIWRLGHTT